MSEEEYAQAYQWYEEQETVLGDRFEQEVSEFLEKIAAHPQNYHYSHKPYREAVLKQFPFTIVYKINKDRTQIFVSAIYHTSRHPGKKRR